MILNKLYIYRLLIMHLLIPGYYKSIILNL